jgi:hypothetical protein
MSQYGKQGTRIVSCDQIDDQNSGTDATRKILTLLNGINTGLVSKMLLHHLWHLSLNC